MKTLRLALAVLLAAYILDGTAAQATNYTSNVSTSGRWDDTNSWTPTGVPGANDRATIVAGDTIYVDSTSGDEFIDTLVLEDHASAPGIMDFRVGGSLTISRVLDMEHCETQSGRVTFSGSATGTAGELKVGGNIAAHGSIQVTGTDGGKISSVASTNILTLAPESLITAESGDLEIAAKMEMDGTIRADTSDGSTDRTITISTYGPRAGSTGSWEILSTHGVLKFDTTSAVNIDASAGRFKMTAGKLDIDQDVTFYGGYYESGGTLDVAFGKTFTILGRYFADCP
ncbi:MAG: hypothetical protein GY778_04660 [bacterium]|nr:hypothetical protein [bacterium]